MRLLLDTHAFYWWTTGDPALSLTARAAIGEKNNQLFVSSVSAWEIILKFRSGKELGFAKLASDVIGEIDAQGFTELPINTRHAILAANLPFHHKDPADRFLIAQALIEDMTIISIDSNFSPYGSKLLW